MASTRRNRLQESQALPGVYPPAAALALLLQAHQTAQAKQRDVWEFALELSSLCTAGATDNQLRSLILSEHVRHAVEQTELDSRTRIFRPVANLGLWPRSCFVLTEAGFKALKEAAKRAVEKPFWKSRQGELCWGDLVVKRFDQPAESQELVLAQFQKYKWRVCIADPLPSVPGLGRKKRLQDTIANLNRAHLVRVIRFGGGGDGKSICWRYVGGEED